jgi:hypothetical protein
VGVLAVRDHPLFQSLFDCQAQSEDNLADEIKAWGFPLLDILNNVR